MIEEVKELYIRANKGIKLLVNCSALDYNSLRYGGYGLHVYTEAKELENLRVGRVRLEHNHISTLEDCECIDEENNIWLPSPERALIDTIKYLDTYWIEGPLIESLQNYIEMCNGDFSKLYEAGRKYDVNKETIDYWIKEAEEEQYMSR